jgi:hypothetical protein
MGRLVMPGVRLLQFNGTRRRDEKTDTDSFTSRLIVFRSERNIGSMLMCSRAQRYNPSQRIKLADAVFIGKVIEIKNTPRDKDTGSYVETVKFEIKKAWKQDLDSFVVIQNKIQGCINGFEVNEEWLVYVYEMEDSTLGTYCCCSRTKVLSKAAEDLKEFESNGEQQREIRQRSLSPGR